MMSCCVVRTAFTRDQVLRDLALRDLVPVAMRAELRAKTECEPDCRRIISVDEVPIGPCKKRSTSLR